MTTTRPLGFPRVPLPRRIAYVPGAHPMRCAAHNADALAAANLADRWRMILVALGLADDSQYPDQLAEWAYLATPWLAAPDEGRYRRDFAYHYRRAVLRRVLQALEPLAARIDEGQWQTRPSPLPLRGEG